MAQRVTQFLVDDLNGAKASETVQFGLDGKTFEIDLDEANAGELRDVLAVYVENGRKVGRTRRVASLTPLKAGSPRADRARSQEIRDWARTQGMKVNERGRIPGDVTDAYQRAHQGAGV